MIVRFLRLPCPRCQDATWHETFMVTGRYVTFYENLCKRCHLSEPKVRRHPTSKEVIQDGWRA